MKDKVIAASEYKGRWTIVCESGKWYRVFREHLGSWPHDDGWRWYEMPEPPEATSNQEAR